MHVPRTSRTRREAPRWRSPLGNLLGGNDATLLADAERTFPSMLEAIASATDHVHLETYRIQSDDTGTRFAEALAARAREGVEVRVLADAVGSIFASSRLVHTIEDAGGRFRFYRPIRLGEHPAFWHRRDHRKILVVDGRVGFVGGSNLCDEHLPSQPGGAAWRDTNVRLEGPVVRELAKEFRRSWWTVTGEELDASRYLPPTAAIAGGSHGALVLANREWRRRHTIRRGYLSAFRHARRSIHLTQAYFIPDRGIQRALAAAVRRGVDVQVLLGGISDVPAVQHATRHLYGRLLSRGIRIHEWPGRVLHAKTVCVDGNWSVIGSYNLDHRSFRHNLEIVAAIAGDRLGSAMDELFRRDVALSREVTVASWRSRSRWQRLLGTFWFWLRHWL